MNYDRLIASALYVNGTEAIAWLFVGALVGLAAHFAKSWLIVGEPGVRPLVEDGLGLASSSGEVDAHGQWCGRSLRNMAGSMGAAVSLIGFLRYGTSAGPGMTEFLCSFVTGFGGSPPCCG